MDQKTRSGMPGPADVFGDVPDDYFRRMQAGLQERIESRIRQQRRMKRVILPVAASALVLMGLGTALFFRQKPEPQLAINQVATDTVKQEMAKEQMQLSVPEAGKLPALDSLRMIRQSNDSSLSGMLDAIEMDDIILYLIEKEEFEF